MEKEVRTTLWVEDAFKEERGAYPVCIEEAIRLLEMSYDDDVISRQALLEQIEIDSGDEPGYYGDNWKFIDTIKNMPPAQPGIVRCKDCMYWVAHDKRCVYLNHGFAPNMWCCHGRRTDE